MKYLLIFTIALLSYYMHRVIENEFSKWFITYMCGAFAVCVLALADKVIR